MIAFWLIAALFAAGALACVLRPLLRGKRGERVSRSDANVAIYKDQLRELDAELAAGTLTPHDHQRARLELEARLLEDVPAVEVERASPGGRRAALAVALAIPLLAVAVYVAIGTPRALNSSHEVEPTAEQINGMVARLAAKLRENPDDVDGWKLLGRSYTVLGRLPDAVDAYAKAAQRAPRDAQLLADFADVLAVTRGEKLAGEPERLVERALEIEPNNLKALALAGTAAYERQDYARAAELWGRMLPLVPADSEDARMIANNVDEAKKLAGIGSTVQPAAKNPKEKEKEQAHPGVRGTVALAPSLEKQVKADDLVFVFARAAEGPPMPLAVLRARAGDLPLAFALNDSMAMAQGLSVSAFPKVVVTARIAKSGSAKPAPGDLQGASSPVANDAAGVKVLIDSVVR